MGTEFDGRRAHTGELKMSGYTKTTYSLAPADSVEHVYCRDDAPRRLPPKVCVPVGRVQLKKALVRPGHSQELLDKEQARLDRLMEDYLNGR